MEQALTACAEIVHRRAGWVLAASIFLTVLAAVHAARTLSVNTSTTDMISADVPFRRHHTQFVRAFPQFTGTLLAVIDAPVPERATEAAREVARRLRRENRVIRSVDYPADSSFFRRNGLLFLKEGELSRLADRLAAAEPMLARLARDPSLRELFDLLEDALRRGSPEERAELETFLERMAEVAEAQGKGAPLELSWEALFGETHVPKHQFLIIHPVLEPAALQPAAKAIGAVRRAAAEAGLGRPGAGRLRLTGEAALGHEELQSAQVGSGAASLLSFVLVFLLLMRGLGSWTLVAGTTLTLLMGLAWTAALAALLVGSLNLISVAFAVLFIGLGVDFGIHVSLRFREELERGGGQAGALLRTARGAGGGLLLSALTAAVGFFSFLPTDYRGLAELGLIAGCGMFVALAANLTVLPAWFTLFPPRLRPAGAPSSLAAAFIQRRARAIFAAGAALGLAGAAALPLLRFDFNPLHLKDPRMESVATFRELAHDPATSPYTLQILAPDLRRAVLQAARLERLPGVERAVTLASFVPAGQDRKLEILDRMAAFLTPALTSPPARTRPDAAELRAARERLASRLRESSGTAARRLERALTGLGEGSSALAEFGRRLLAHFPAVLERLREGLAAERVSLETLPRDLREQWIAPDGRARIELRPASPLTDNRAMRGFAQEVLAAAPEATGTPVIISEAGRAVVAAFLQATGIALTLISVILYVLLRRWAQAAMVLAPLGLAALWTAGASVALGLPLNFANIIVLPLLLGLGVSSAIHFVMRHREEGLGAAVLETSTSRAVLYSALTTIAAFGSLGFSGHRGMASMGQLLAIAITFTLLSTLVILPSMMAVIARRPEEER